eukprot:30942-Pelagococcus_subviridis.AAC.17
MTIVYCIVYRIAAQPLSASASRPPSPSTDPSRTFPSTRSNPPAAPAAPRPPSRAPPRAPGTRSRRTRPRWTRIGDTSARRRTCRARIRRRRADEGRGSVRSDERRRGGVERRQKRSWSKGGVEVCRD